MGTRVEHGILRGVASACVAWLALTGIGYLVVFASRRRVEHGWLAAQSLLGAVYPMSLLGIADDAALAVPLTAALALAAAASVRFTHGHFGLEAPGYMWWTLPCLGVAAAVLGAFRPAARHATLVVALLVVAAAIAHQLDVLWRLARRPAGRFNARLMLGAWLAMASGCIVDVASWLDGRSVIGGALGGATVLAFVYTVALARHHGLALELAERDRSELEQRLATIEVKSREIETLNHELRRQIVLRSRQLASAQAGRGGVRDGFAAGHEIGEHYQVHGWLGRGGMGIVYEVVRRSDGRRLALKLLDGHAPPAVVARFAREAEILARLHHPNLVSIVDVDVTSDGRPFLVMELVAGLALDRALDGPVGVALDLARRLEVLIEVATGLVAIHDAGIVHRDLKPANILIGTSAPVVKIADFGVSRFVRTDDPDALAATEPTSLRRLTVTGAVVGTPGYIAPELFDGTRDPAPPVDVFSFGVIACELLGGRRLLAPRARGSGPLRTSPCDASIADQNPDLPPALVELVERCLACAPELRPSAGELVAALRALPALPARTMPACERSPTASTVRPGVTR